MPDYYTTGQVAKKLRVSVSTLKRWISSGDVGTGNLRNASGWRLFSAKDLEKFSDYKKQKRKQGRRFNETTLIPAVRKNQKRMT
ncbi:MAG: MerR family transcriptional regulator [Fibrobacterota bacterium]